MLNYSVSYDLFDTNMLNLIAESPVTGKPLIIRHNDNQREEHEPAIERAFIKELASFTKTLVLARVNAYRHSHLNPGENVTYLKTAAADTLLKMIPEAARITCLYSFCSFFKRTCENHLNTLTPGKDSRYRKNYLSGYDKLMDFINAIILEKENELRLKNDSKSELTPAQNTSF